MSDLTTHETGYPDPTHGRHLRLAFAIYAVLLVLGLLALGVLAGQDEVAPLLPPPPVDEVPALELRTP